MRVSTCSTLAIDSCTTLLPFQAKREPAEPFSTQSKGDLFLVTGWLSGHKSWSDLELKVSTLCGHGNNTVSLFLSRDARLSFLMLLSQSRCAPCRTSAVCSPVWNSKHTSICTQTGLGCTLSCLCRYFCSCYSACEAAGQHQAKISKVKKALKRSKPTLQAVVGAVVAGLAVARSFHQP